MNIFNMAGCSTVCAGQGIGLDPEAIKKVLEAKVHKGGLGDGAYDWDYNPRCLLLCYPAQQRVNGKRQGVEAMLASLGGFVIYNLHSAHNGGYGMNIWLIPGKENAILYERPGGDGINAKERCKPDKPDEMSPEQLANILDLNAEVRIKDDRSPAQQGNKKKKRINWKKKYQQLKLKVHLSK